MSKRTTVGKVARHLRSYEWKYMPPRQLKYYTMQRVRADMEASLNRFKEEQDELFKILRMEYNMMYNELLCMDNEDKDIIDLTDDVDDDKLAEDCAWIATNLPLHDDDVPLQE